MIYLGKFLDRFVLGSRFYLKIGFEKNGAFEMCAIFYLCDELFDPIKQRFRRSII